MMNKKIIHNIGRRLGFQPWQSEKDYIQHLFLRELYEIISTQLIFKGGTALQKVHCIPRFSRDLDFNANTQHEFASVMEKLRKKLIEYQLDSTVKREKHKFAENYLFLFDSPELKNSLSVQISLREKTILQPEFIVITPLYTEIPPYSVYVMNKKEILAEKIRAMLTRGFPRDVYDIWFLFRQDTSVEWDLINQKTNFSKKSFENKLNEIEQQWDNELNKLIQHYPKFEQVKNLLKEKLLKQK